MGYHSGAGSKNTAVACRQGGVLRGPTVERLNAFHTLEVLTLPPVTSCAPCIAKAEEEEEEEEALNE
mgnify:CR=1 FL=1